MKQIAFFFFFLASIAATAQVIRADELRLKSGGTITIDGYTVHGVSNDPALADSSTIQLVTEAAAKGYADTKGRIDTLYKLNDTTMVVVYAGGAEDTLDVGGGVGGGGVNISALPTTTTLVGTDKVALSKDSVVTYQIVREKAGAQYNIITSGGIWIDVRALTDEARADTLQYAILATGADGFVSIPPGDYKGTITLDRRVSLYGVHAEHTKIYNDVGHAFVVDRTAQGFYRTTISDLRFETTRDDSLLWDAIHIMPGTNSASFSFKNCSVTEADRDAIHVDGENDASEIRFVGCRFTGGFDIGRHGLYTNSSGSYFDIYSPDFDVYFDSTSLNNTVVYRGNGEAIITNLGGEDNIVRADNLENYFSRHIGGRLEFPLRKNSEIEVAACYKLDEISGTSALDYSRNFNSATVAGGVTVGRDSVFENYYQFDGSTGYLLVPHNSAMTLDVGNALVVSAMVRMDTLQNMRILRKAGIFELTYEVGAGFRAFITTTTSAWSRASDNTEEAGKWYHLTLTWDGTNFVFYVNGREVDSSTPTGVLAASVNDLYVGSLSGSSAFFKGGIKDVVILNYVGKNIAQRLYQQSVMGIPASDFADPDLTSPNATIDITNTAIDIAQQGAASGQMLAWNGTKYAPVDNILNKAAAVTVKTETIHSPSAGMRTYENPNGAFYSTTAATAGAIQIVAANHGASTAYYTYEIEFFRNATGSAAGKVGQVTLQLRYESSVGYRYGYVVWGEGNVELTRKAAIGKVTSGGAPVIVIGDITDTWGSTDYNAVRVKRITTNAAINESLSFTISQITSLSALTISQTYTPGSANFSMTVSGNSVNYDNTNYNLGVGPAITDPTLSDATFSGLLLKNTSATVLPGIKLLGASNTVASLTDINGIEWHLGTAANKVASLRAAANGSNENAAFMYMGTSDAGTFTEHFELDRYGNTKFGYNGGTGTDYLIWDNQNKRAAVGGASVASAKFAVTSTTMGFLPPRMTTTQRNAIATPATGLQVYNTSLNKLNFYTGSAWSAVLDSATALTTYAALAGATFTGDVIVPAEAYSSSWNGSNEVPTKNDVYDAIQSSDFTATVTQSGSDTLQNTATCYGFFQRTGNYVDLDVRIEVAFTSTGNANTFYFDPPIASDFTTDKTDVIGRGGLDTQALSSTNIPQQRCLAFASTADDKIGISVDPPDSLTYPDNRMYITVQLRYVIQ